MTPLYQPKFCLIVGMMDYLLGLEWEQRTEARSEYFMSEQPVSYTYGRGDQARTYHSREMSHVVYCIMDRLNAADGDRYNVCFLNRYDHEKHALGWHADDSSGTDLDHPIAVVSFGSEREIWWRRIGEKGVVPPEQRQLLGDGSLFVMPAGMQRTHQHRIPKAGRPVLGPRVSLTFRHLVSP